MHRIAAIARATQTRKVTRIQREKTDVILAAALKVFSAEGFRGATIDQIAREAQISKPNILYYFDGKAAIHAALLNDILETWLEPLERLDAAGDPVEELLAYVLLKLDMARDYPMQSRLFAHEVMNGAPRILGELEGPLRKLVEEKARLVQSWVEAGRLAPLEPRHLFFMIWASTQHYSDFEVQVAAISPGQDRAARFDEAKAHLEAMFRRMLTP